ncbi:MAG TPA: LacI family DNA-binding transcriptional regulator [Amnibacterium sp.]|jgi:DNA-binding LacI/PurR family transcriptional regulator|uniref:LacI family DNA-binding transcriptional regulator n=1 Tax=Amnibacterium sp. TaxID=1872496 RepID=UPI002F94B1BB
MARVRLEDVAKHAGVSMKTVSNVVHDFPHVSAKMRERVQTSIDLLGYRPNAMGRGLATGRTGLIALALADVTIPYFAELARMISTHSTKRGYRLLLEQTDSSIEEERAIVSASEAGLVDGVIFQPAAMSSLEIAKHRSDVPIVLLGEGPAPLGLDHVMIDNVEAATTVTRHLASLGRRRIGFLGHEQGRPTETSKIRIMGYQRGLELEDLPVDPSLLVASAAISAQAAAVALGAALDGGLRIDGLVCRDDLAAIGALRALAERGIDVPGEVAVTGWDDIAMASFTHPTLTTIAADTTALADTALDLLEERISGFEGLGRHLIVPHHLVIRESAPESA